jgi:hypothetical protein
MQAAGHVQIHAITDDMAATSNVGQPHPCAHLALAALQLHHGTASCQGSRGSHATLFEASVALLCTDGDPPPGRQQCVSNVCTLLCVYYNDNDDVIASGPAGHASMGSGCCDCGYTHGKQYGRAALALGLTLSLGDE